MAEQLGDGEWSEDPDTIYPFEVRIPIPKGAARLGLGLLAMGAKDGGPTKSSALTCRRSGAALRAQLVRQGSGWRIRFLKAPEGDLVRADDFLTLGEIDTDLARPLGQSHFAEIEAHGMLREFPGGGGFIEVKPRFTGEVSGLQDRGDGVSAGCGYVHIPMAVAAFVPAASATAPILAREHGGFSCGAPM